MRILITGVNGFVGKELYAALKNAFEVIGIYNNSTTSFDNCYKLDLSNDEEVISFCDNPTIKNIDTVIHLAAKTANANNSEDISLLTINTALAKNTALMAKKLNVKHFINLSSSSVYSNNDGIYNEGSVIDPSLNSDCIYGLSKFNSEIIINHFLSKTKIIITHLRTGIICGEGVDRSRLIPVIENEIKQNNTATLFGNGERILNIIQIEKLVKYIKFFILQPVNEIINVADENISLLNLTERIISKKGNKQTDIILKENGNKTKFILDTKKLKKLIPDENN